MFAVIKTGGKQYHVVANQVVKVEKVIGNAGDVVEFNDILMVGQKDNAIIGAPVVADALVTAEIIKQARARKVISFKKRRRQNSKCTRGHRQEVTILRILEILTGGLKPKRAVAKPIKEEAAVLKETTKKTKATLSIKKTAKKPSEKKSAPQKKAAVVSNSKED
ncbi:50S ribosomal protein L21 [Bartonella quintana]|uniref:Large ribosomal subunit protein bL21 n=2 Tax=Bartonella quintana TaxID=803 RepID=W3TZJ8_BARQI|nr:50S ribosomal protein L21 [Bartonella quintana]ETS13552.1 50S ribosomal protein L21 [Bartonella quintana BQ2-D70]ETS15010.1 50S ribosomal protein L21 [Bartonella quintana JK 73rel]ETS16850.1 50S ribosomal protein L21 [Bartonella quintana JK 73]KEC61876.1 50S ribosomal protein L21 [Bartonella quintana JK 31]KEC63281.1 50S ribosomal protein L21 [Bartonella quintana JK 63]